MLSLSFLWTLIYEITLPKYKLHPHDVGDSGSTDLVKQYVSQKEINRRMNNIDIMENGNVVLSFLQTPLFDNRYQLGLLLVFEEDVPSYTLEFRYERSFSLEFEKGKMLLTKQGDSCTRLYSLEGKYMGRVPKREVIFPKKEIRALDGSIYTIESQFLCDALIKYTSDGDKQILYKLSNIMMLKKCLFYSLLIGGFACIGASKLLSHHKKVIRSRGKDFIYGICYIVKCISFL